MPDQDELSVAVRLTLVEERLHEGFLATNHKLDAIIHGETVNCTLHKTRMDLFEEKLIDVYAKIDVIAKTKAEKSNMKLLWTTCIFLGTFMATAVIKHVWF